LLSHTHLPVVSACLAFVADTGCRLGELHSLEPGDFIQTPLGYVAKVTGKTGARLVPVTRSAAEALIPHLPLKMSPWWLCRLMSRGFEEAGIKGSTHTLRHTFATLWEGDEFALQRIMGHAKIETTRIYRNLKTDRLSIQHNQFSPVARLPVGAQQIAMI
jgi:integrase